MAVLRSVSLSSPAGRAGGLARICLIELVELGGGEPRHIVNLRQGREGRALVESTITPTPLRFEEAQRLFDSALVARLNAGYREVGGDPRGAAPAASSARTSTTGGASPQAALLADLAFAMEGRLDPPTIDKRLFRAGLTADPAFAAPALALFDKIGPAGATAPLVHALARCARERAALALERIASEAGLASVRDLARYARACRWMGAAARPDPTVHEALAAAESLDALAARERAAPGSASAILIALGQGGAGAPEARARLLSLLAQAPARPPFLRAIRRLFKFAELGDDAELFAETARVLERARPMYRRAVVWKGEVYVAELGRHVSPHAEAASAATGLGLSDQTSFYLRRRIWRALRKRGELGQGAYVRMAGALAARFEDEDLRGQTSGPDPAAAFFSVGAIWSLAHVMFGASPDARFNETFARSGGHARAYAPPFAELWRAHPEATLVLARDARTQAVRRFAAELVGGFDPATLAAHALLLADLAASPEAALRAAAARALEPLLGRPGVDPALIARLLETPEPGLRRLAHLAATARPGGPWAEPEIGVAALLASEPETVARVGAWMETPPGEAALRDLARAFAARLSAEPAEVSPERRARWETGAARLVRLAQGRALGLTSENFATLAGNPSVAVRTAGLTLLAASGMPLDNLPDAFWTRGLSAEDAGLRAASVGLMGALGDSALARRAPEIRAAAFDLDPAPRAAARSVAARLAALDPNFGAALFEAVWPHLFQAEPADGFADDLARLVDAALKEPRDAMEERRLWRLLQAQARGARLVAAQALAARPFGVLSTRRWARLTNHPFAEVRMRAVAAFDAREAEFRAAPEDAAAMLDTPWADARTAMAERLARWPAEAFSVESLAEMADSNDAEVQAEARALLRRTLAPGKGGETLARLLEHPSPGFHLFVTELLVSEPMESEAVFATFVEAARMILFQIDVGRAAKTRVWATLRREALRDRARAEAMGPLLAQMSLSATERDRGPALGLMRDVALAYPDLSTPLTLRRAAS